MVSILRVLGPLLFSVAGRFGFVVVFLAFNRYGRRAWRWFWE
jgi:hypothetical protein